MSDYYFSIKKFLVFVLRPSSLIFIFLVLVSIYIILGKRKGRRNLLLFLTVILYYLSTTPFLPYFLLKNLEKDYPPPAREKLLESKKIIVLTGRIYGGKDLDLHEKFSRETLIRFYTAVKLKKEDPQREIVIVGGSYEDKNYKGASYLEEFAKSLNIPVKAIDIPLDTKTSIRVIKEYLLQTTGSSQTPFILVTSAYHLPRSMMIFKKEGLNPIPYPSNYAHKLCEPTLSVTSFIPSDVYLTLTNLAFHEYLGMISYKVMGKLL